MADKFEKDTVVFHPPTFPQCECLGEILAAHALWYYYLCARHAFETHIQNIVVYEGEPDPQVDFKQLFTSIALAYGIQPETMTKFWHRVDSQCDKLSLPLLPDEEQYRFNTTPEIKTQ